MRLCPHCDSRNDDDSGYCRGCGQPLATLAGKDEASGKVQVEAKTGDPEGGEGSRHAAGRDLDAPTRKPAETDGGRRRLLEANSCPHCDAEVPGGYAFCPACGEDVRAVVPDREESRSSGPGQGAGAGSGSGSRDASLLRIVEEGEVAGSYPLEPGQTIIGREKGDLKFPTDVFLSNPHARLFFDEGRLYVEDLGSVNGVFVRVAQPRRLRDGDVFLLGRQLLRLDDSPFGVASPAEPSEPPLHTLEESPDEDVEDATVDLHDRTARYGFPPQEVIGCLTSLLSDGNPGSRFLLDGREVVLGRERGDIVFTRDHYMSNEHAALRRDDGCFILEDLGSRNGTFLAVREATEVGDGTSLLVGRQLFRVRLE